LLVEVFAPPVWWWSIGVGTWIDFNLLGLNVTVQPDAAALNHPIAESFCFWISDSLPDARCTEG